MLRVEVMTTIPRKGMTMTSSKATNSQTLMLPVVRTITMKVERARRDEKARKVRVV